MKNHSAHQYFSPTVKPLKNQAANGDGQNKASFAESSEGDDQVPLRANWLFCMLAGTFWYLQFFFYQMGESQMGAYGFSSWTLHMASIIIFSTLWGIYFKEWRGAQGGTKFLVVVMLLFLIGSTMIIGWGNKISADEAAAKAAVTVEHQ